MDVLAQHQLQPSQRAHFKFTFVRDPFARLASFYMDKMVRRRPGAGFEFYLWGAMRIDLGFSTIARIVCQVPDALAPALLLPARHDSRWSMSAASRACKNSSRRQRWPRAAAPHPRQRQPGLRLPGPVQRARAAGPRRYAGDRAFGYQAPTERCSGTFATHRWRADRPASADRWRDSACRDDRTAAMTWGGQAARAHSATGRAGRRVLAQAAGDHARAAARGVHPEGRAASASAPTESRCGSSQGTRRSTT